MNKRNSYLMAGLVMTGVLTVLIVMGIFWTPYDPNAMAAGPKLSPPSLAHLMGTDSFGRDIFTRVLKGAGTTYGIALCTVAIGAVCGTMLGAVTGYFGGIVDDVLMRLGDVLTAFSMEELVYSPTLGDWRTHNGVDIAAQQGTTVLAASAGAVLSVTDDPLMGTTVVLEHDNGYQTTYANLQAKPNVEAGDPVSAGQIIGAVGTTAAAESGQPHLHFAVTKDGKAVDPNEYLSG